MIVIIILLYMLYKLWPNELADRIKYFTFAGIDDEELAKYISIPNMEEKNIDIISLEWKGWAHLFENKMDIVMRVIGGYGGLFAKVLELGKFYFRELVIHRNAKIVRNWIKDAIYIGILKKGEDPNGVTQYFLDRDGIQRLIDFLRDAFEELIGSH